MPAQPNHGTTSPAGGDAVLAQLAVVAATALGFDQGWIVLDDTTVTVGDTPEAAAWARLDAIVRQRGATVVVHDLSHTADPELVAGAYVGVPVSVGEEVVGLLRVTDHESRTVPARQVRLLVELARLVALHLRPDLAPEPDAPVDGPAIDLARAVREHEIIPWYQPIIALQTGRVTGVEALARWRRPNGQVEPPSTFIPVAERSDLIIELDLAVIRQALTDLARWQQVRPDFRLSVNLSGRHLDHADGLAELQTATHRAGVSPGTVDLELTETARPKDIERAWRVIEDLRAAGFTVWFDDFGAGLYDLQDLMQLPVDGIKIDRSFAAQLERPMNVALIGALTAAAGRVGLQVVIEGIETERQSELAVDLGCELGQGFHWSRPVAADGVTAWVTGADPAFARPAGSTATGLTATGQPPAR